MEKPHTTLPMKKRPGNDRQTQSRGKSEPIWPASGVTAPPAEAYAAGHRQAEMGYQTRKGWRGA